MEFSLPKLGKAALEFPHFPSRHQAFIFRAWECVPAEKIASVLGTTEENVRITAEQMGLPDMNPGDLWLNKGYITIIRRMWHILPYSQLLELLEMDEQTLAVILREEDFLDIKLSDKPVCEPVFWRELTKDELLRTKEIKTVLSKIDFSGVRPFDFKYTVPQIKFSGKENFSTRMIYAFSGLYQHAFDVDSRTFCPDEMLEAYSKLGVNGIWTQGVLSQLTEFPWEPELSAGYETRLANMRDFARRLEKFGLKLYLYINEPRYMPAAFFDNFPHLKGHTLENGDACLCTSLTEVQEYLRRGVEYICRAVPEIGGFFTITRSENLTNCYSHSGDEGIECSCPRCRDRTVGEVVSEVISCVADGVRRADPKIKVFAWSWGWRKYNEEIIRRLPKDVILLSQSELDMPYEIGGVKGNILDYSMSIIGPGERAKNEWAIAKECGLETGAKVQISTTWEASTVPALPVGPSIEKHMEGLMSEGVSHLLLSWTLGGYPCINIARAAKFFYENYEMEEESPILEEAQNQFSEAFREFPFHCLTLYRGPQNAGPANPLYEKPTGYRSSMTCFAYDDLESWRSIYPVDVFENQFEKLCEKWGRGLEKIKDSDSETAIMAEATYCLFKSSLDQIKFIRARDEGDWNKAVQMAEAEIETAKTMLKLMNKNAAIGFEAANHYYFSKGELAEKILNCNYIIRRHKDVQRANQKE